MTMPTVATPFVVAAERHVRALPVWLAGLGCNACSHDGGQKINVGRTRGRKYRYVASIVVKDSALFEAALSAVKESVFGKASHD
jgi:hypothetical protein